MAFKTLEQVAAISDNYERLTKENIMPIKLSFTDVKTGSDPVSAGQHLVALYDAKMTTTKKGDPMLKVTWKCQDGDTDAGRQVFDQYPIMATTMWKLKGLLEALGEDASDEYELVPENLVGTLAIIEVEHRDYEGKPQARVKYVNSADGETATPDKPKRGKNSPF